MSTFLEKLKGPGSDAPKPEEKAKNDKEKLVAEELPQGVIPLDIDMVQSGGIIVISAQVPGATQENLSIMLEGENDILVIRGERKQPKIVVDMLKKITETESKGKNIQRIFSQENKWGTIYRRIVLPGKMDPAKMKTEFASGTLLITLGFSEEAGAGPDGVIRLKDLVEEEKRKAATPSQQAAPIAPPATQTKPQEKTAPVQPASASAPEAGTAQKNGEEEHAETLSAWQGLMKKVLHPRHQANPEHATMKQVGNTLVIEIPINGTGAGVSNISIKKGKTKDSKKPPVAKP